MKIKANAKVNLSLDVTGKRPDGYHTLESVFQSVSLCDVLTVELSQKITVTCSDNSVNGEDNLCFKAAELFFDAADIKGGAEIFIEKHIPMAGGLGGGSADAAATLVALNELCNRPLSDERLLQIAVRLGADVPFCMLGGTKLCEGIGEIMTDLKSLPDCFIVIAKKGEKSSTGNMYRALDSAENRRHPDTKGMIRGLENGDLRETFKGAYNCFESVCDAEALNEAREVAEALNAAYCGLSGAGPTVISVFDSLADAEKSAMLLSEKGFFTQISEPCEKGVQIIE